MRYKMGGRTRDVVSAQLRVMACRLRAYGHDYNYIAERCGFEDAAYAYKVVVKAVKALPKESVEEIRDQELYRLDMLQKIAWKRLQMLTRAKGLRTVGGSKRNDALDPIPVILRIMERRAKLIGLDAPMQYRILDEEAEKMAAITGRPKQDIIEMAAQIAQEAGASTL